MEKYYRRDEWYHIIPLMFIVIFVPLIVYLKVVPLSGASYQFWNGQKENMDFFSYYKSLWLLIFTGFALLMLGIKYYQNNFKVVKKSYFFIPIGIYSLLAILSTMTSEYKDIAKMGFVDRYEGIFVLLAYMAILFIAINLVDNPLTVKVLLGALFTGAIIIGIIGVFQYIGYDIWKLSFGKNLMLSEKYKQYADKLNFNFGKHTIYATLYNTNYVGSYMDMIFPITLALLFLSKNIVLKIFSAALTILSIVNLFGSHSRAGLVGGVIAILFLLIMMIKYMIKHWKKSLIVLMIAIFAIIGVSSAYGVQKIKNYAKSIIYKDQNLVAAGVTNPIKDFIIDKNKADFITTTETLRCVAYNDSVAFMDEKNNPIKIKFDKEKNKIYLLNDKYKDYDITTGKLNGKEIIQIKKGYIKIFYSLSYNHIAMIDNKGYDIDLDKPIEKWGFEGKELMGSSRGYIWSRSIPLLKDTIFLGHGPDTYAIYFPQQDFKGKYIAFLGDMWQLVDKPHNYYLQVAINTGVLSLVALLSLFFMYFVQSVKLYIKNDYNDFMSIVGVGIFAAVFGYLGAAFFNDSIVSVAPIFWTILGMGIGINTYIKSLKEKTLKREA